MNFKIENMNHITFTVENIDKSVEFYQKAFRAKLLARGKNLAYFELAGVWIALNTEKNIPANQRQTTYTHVAFSMSEEDQLVYMEYLGSLNIDFTRGRLRHEREGKSIYLRDLDGHLFEFHSKSCADRLALYKEEREDIEVYTE